MKLTFFIGGLNGGGAERVLCQLATSLRRKGYEIEILTVSNTPVSYEIDNAIRIVSLENEKQPASRIAKVLFKLNELKKYVINNKTDAYVVFLTYTSVALCHFKKYIHVPIIMSDRNDPSLYNCLTKKMLSWAVKNVDGIVNQTQEIDNYYHKHFKIKTSTVIPNAISSYFNAYNGQRDKRIVSVGRLNKQKNFPLLIKAFSEIHNDFPDFNLYIYGNGPLKNNLVSLSEQLGIGNKVVFPGYIDNLSEEIKSARLFAITSNHEGISNALLEAMSLGIPCISTDSNGGGARMIIENNKNGILVRKNDLIGLEKAMRSVLSNEQLSLQLSKNGAEVKEKFTPEYIYSEWEEYIQQTITNYKYEKELK